MNLHHGKIEEAIVRAVVEHTDGIKLQVDVVGLDLTALIVKGGRLSSELGRFTRLIRRGPVR